MTYNRPSGDSAEELHERAVAALVRVWGVSDTEAREAIERAKRREARLRRNGTVDVPHQRVVYLEHGAIRLREGA